MHPEREVGAAESESNPFEVSGTLVRSAPAEDQSSSPQNSTVLKVVVASLFILAIACAFYFGGDWLNLSTLADHETQLRDLQTDFPALVFGVAFLVYVLVTGLSLPGAAGLTLVLAWYFGFRDGLLLTSFASTTGATIAFTLSRFMFRDSMLRRFGDRLEDFNRSLEQEGPFYLFMLRLIPAVPFFVINSVMGLTPIKTRTFWWVSQIGMLPGTAIYSYAGSRVPNLRELSENGVQAVFTPVQLAQILIAFGLLGTFPLLVRMSLKRFRPQVNS